MTDHPTSDRRGRRVRSPLSVVTDGQTYRNLAYLLARFPLGIAYFTVFLTGLVLGVATLPLGVGVVVLAAVLGVAEHAAILEAALLERLLGRRVPVSRTDPNELPAWPYLKTVGTRERNYRLVAFCLLSFFAGIATFVVVVTGVTLSFALAAAPLLFWLPGMRYDFTQLGIGGGDFGRIDTLPEALLASVVGLVLGVAFLYAVNALARGLGRVTARLVADD